MRFLHSLSEALPLLLLLSTVCATGRILIDPVLMFDDEAKLSPTHAGPDMHVASFRKEVVHKNNEFRRNTKVAHADTEAVQHDGKKIHGKKAHNEDHDEALDPEFERKIKVAHADTEVVRHDGKKAHNKNHDEAQDTYVSLINATPYRWHLIYNHSYQLKRWDHEWPTYIMPGATVTVRANNYGRGKEGKQDSAGEVTYELLKTKKPALFQVQYRPGKPHSVWVQFLEKLKTVDKDWVGRAIELGFSREPGGVGFMLAGTEGDFISNHSPAQWMQSQLPEIGNLTLREILLPRSHHSGMWISRDDIGPDPAGNTVTQNMTLFQQLRDGGVRVIDYRPMFWKKRLHAGHGSFLEPDINAVVGVSLHSMIHDCNRFTRKYPGELLIWDVHDDPINGDRNYTAFNEANILTLWSQLQKIHWRTALPIQDKDITRRPLSFFINSDSMGMGQSSVLIRVPASWAQINGYPGIKEGFVTSDMMPFQSHSSSTDNPDRMIFDQIKHLNESRPARDSVMYNMNWVLDQTRLIQTPVFTDSIVETSMGTWPALYGRFWRALSDTKYPNMISMDFIRDDSLKVMAMVVNKCLAARRCGPLGGKVTPVPEAEDPDPDESGW